MDGVDRRGFLKCMAWAGTGVVWSFRGGVPTSQAFGQETSLAKGDLHFVQISDTHMGFNKPANPDPGATLQVAIDKINSLGEAPEFIIHTGDLSHTSKSSEFDQLDQILKGAKPKQLFFVPGEHDTAVDDGKQYLERYGKGAKGSGWYSFTHRDVHFVGLSNVAVLEGLGHIGAEQLQWLAADLKAQPASRPVVVFAHIPLWSVYPEWGWGTGDSEEALRLLKPFGSVTVLNGHIHQIMQKVEGNVTFHTAMSTAFPQPAPGTAKSAGPMKVEDSRLRSVLGITEVQSVVGQHRVAVVDSTLASSERADGTGKDLFEKRCGGCHALDRDKEGPKLGGIYGRSAASGGPYPYSKQLRESRIVWTDETLNRWLADPEAMVPGSDMGFRVENAEERELIIRFLRYHRL